LRFSFLRFAAGRARAADFCLQPFSASPIIAALSDAELIGRAACRGDTSALSWRPAMAKRTIGVALIGGGFMGKAHSNAYLKAGKFFDLPVEPVMACFCRRDRAQLRPTAARWGWRDVESDWRRAVARADVDLVDISTPNNLHRDVAVAAARAGKMVFCEKPLAMNVAEARGMVAAARRAGVRTFVAFNYRRAPAVALARRLVEEGRLGRLYHVQACYLQDWIMDPAFPLVWRLRKEVSGSGAHGDINAHIIDLARFITGQEFVEVCGLTETFIKRRPVGRMVGAGLRARGGKKTGRVTVDDACALLARLTGGAVGTFLATRFAAGRRNANRIEIYGSRGALAFDFERMNELEFYDVGDPKHLQGYRRILATDPGHPYMNAWWPPGHGLGYEHTFINLVADIMSAIGTGRRFQPDFADALRVQEVLDAVLLSARERRWVRLSEM
jgi:predicted dehydrogenase